jgi:glycosyltransferase involved in cell wall biosynthesis
MKFGIIVATYKRPDGKTPFFLARALKSIKRQIHEDFLVLLIGDKYEDDEEFKSLSSLLSEEKIYAENLEHAVERERYPDGGDPLWATGGLNAMNRAIEVGLERGINYFCHLDHDDFWSPDHLYNFNEILEKEEIPFMVSYSTSPVFNFILPNSDKESIRPIPRGMIHSSTCVDFSFFSERYRDAFLETGTICPADADLWFRLSETMTRLNIKGKMTKKLTCFHDDEGYSSQ